MLKKINLLTRKRLRTPALTKTSLNSLFLNQEVRLFIV